MMNIRHGTLLAAPLLLLASFAARAQEEEKAPPAPRKPRELTVKVLDPGQEPRQALRFRPAAGSKQRAKLSLRMSMGQGMEDDEIEMQEIPRISMPVNVNVKETRPNGDTAFACRYGKIEIQGKPGQEAMVEMLEGIYAGAEGFGLDAVMTDRGTTVEMKLVVPEGMNPQLKLMMEGMKQSFNQMSFQLPEAPVGKGAKWQVDQQMIEQGITQKVTTIYTLTAAEGNVLELAAEVKVKADEQEFEAPIAPGQKIKLLSLSGSGSGTLRGDLGAVLVTSAALEVSTDNKIEMAPGTAFRTKMKMNLRISSLEETPSRQ